MEYQDLRDWIQIAEEMGELKTLKGCDWNLEIGAITEIVAHKEDGPAVLFEDIKGYPKGYRVLSNSLSSRKRLALTLGLPSGETKNGLRQDLERQLQEHKADTGKIRQ
jgi:4-hydroxy-3-polyprenylbenzoate decarboxylase